MGRHSIVIAVIFACLIGRSAARAGSLPAVLEDSLTQAKLESGRPFGERMAQGRSANTVDARDSAPAAARLGLKSANSKPGASSGSSETNSVSALPTESSAVKFPKGGAFLTLLGLACFIPGANVVLGSAFAVLGGLTLLSACGAADFSDPRIAYGASTGMTLLSVGLLMVHAPAAALVAGGLLAAAGLFLAFHGIKRRNK